MSDFLSRGQEIFNGAQKQGIRRGSDNPETKRESFIEASDPTPNGNIYISPKEADSAFNEYGAKAADALSKKYDGQSISVDIPGGDIVELTKYLGSKKKTSGEGSSGSTRRRPQLPSPSLGGESNRNANPSAGFLD